MPSSITQVHCNWCGRSTNQDILTSHRDHGHEEDGESWYELYEIVRCRGCEGI